MTNKEFPIIEVSYMLRTDDETAADLMIQAGQDYAETRPAEEEFATRVNRRETLTLITYGRNVIKALSYPEIGHEADVMEAAIDKSIAKVDVDATLRYSHAGQQMSGQLPDQD
jgi:hypothetical protein